MACKAGGHGGGAAILVEPVHGLSPQMPGPAAIFRQAHQQL